MYIGIRTVHRRHIGNSNLRATTQLSRLLDTELHDLDFSERELVDPDVAALHRAVGRQILQDGEAAVRERVADGDDAQDEGAVEEIMRSQRPSEAVLQRLAQRLEAHAEVGAGGRDAGVVAGAEAIGDGGAEEVRPVERDAGEVVHAVEVEAVPGQVWETRVERQVWVFEAEVWWESVAPFKDLAVESQNGVV